MAHYIETEDLIVGETYWCEMYDGQKRELTYTGNEMFGDIPLEGYVRYPFFIVPKRHNPPPVMFIFGLVLFVIIFILDALTRIVL